jgi:hypothetical protein
MTENVLDKLRQNRNRPSVPNRQDILIPERDTLKVAAIPNTVRHSAIVIDETIDKPLTTFCKNNKITVELFLEAAWNFANSDPECLQTILDDAQQRYKVRKRAGKLRRLITMLTK